MHRVVKSDRTGAADKPEVVVITGASAGVGRATVREFAKNGAHVGLLARGGDGLEGAYRENVLMAFYSPLGCRLS